MKSVNTKFIRPQLLLSLLLIAMILFEVFLLYSKVYGNLSADAQTAPTGSVVRLDLAAYQKTVNLIDQLKSFTVLPWNIQNSNPFR